MAASGPGIDSVPVNREPPKPVCCAAAIETSEAVTGRRWKFRQTSAPKPANIFPQRHQDPANRLTS
jgi:hypothetical protein